MARAWVVAVVLVVMLALAALVNVADAKTPTKTSPTKTSPTSPADCSKFKTAKTCAASVRCAWNSTKGVCRPATPAPTSVPTKKPTPAPTKLPCASFKGAEACCGAAFAAGDTKTCTNDAAVTPCAFGKGVGCHGTA